MPTLFYEIFNREISLSASIIKKFVKEVEKLYQDLKEEKKVDKLKVLRNKLEASINNNKGKKKSKATKIEFKKLKRVLKKIEKTINKKIQKQESKTLVDVVQKVEKKYRTLAERKEEKRSLYKESSKKISTIDYEKELIELQVELLKLQKYIKANGEKLLIIFEGRDAAGKWGTIKRFREYLNARWARVVALEKPNEEEKTQWYFQRYVKHLPNGGEMTFFDRSWYNRGWVEPVMGFVNKNDYNKFLNDVPKFEKMLKDSGTHIVKFYFSVSKGEQARRFKERESNPLKQYKLSPIDQYSQQLWDKYTLAEYKNFKATHNSDTPWTLIKSDDKKRARLNAIKHVLSQFDYPGKMSAKKLELDPEIVYDGKEKVRILSQEIDTTADLFS